MQWTAPSDKTATRPSMLLVPGGPGADTPRYAETLAGCGARMSIDSKRKSTCMRRPCSHVLTGVAACVLSTGTCPHSSLAEQRRPGAHHQQNLSFCHHIWPHSGTPAKGRSSGLAFLREHRHA